MQLALMVAQVRKERMKLLRALRVARMQHRLRLSKDMTIVAGVTAALRTGERNGTDRCVGVSELARVALAISAAYDAVRPLSPPPDSDKKVQQLTTSLPIAPPAVHSISKMVDDGQAFEMCRNALLFLGKVGARWEQSPDMNPCRRFFGDWQWSLILMK